MVVGQCDVGMQVVRHTGDLVEAECDHRQQRVERSRPERDELPIDQSLVLSGPDNGAAEAQFTRCRLAHGGHFKSREPST
jgi:hypothetical protein